MLSKFCCKLALAIVCGRPDNPSCRYIAGSRKKGHYVKVVCILCDLHYIILIKLLIVLGFILLLTLALCASKKSSKQVKADSVLHGMHSLAAGGWA